MSSGDFSDRIPADLRSRLGDQLFRMITDTIDEVFWVCSSDWSKAYYVSPKYEELFQQPARSLYDDANSWRDSLHPDDIDLLQDALATNAAGSFRSPVLPEFRVVQRDGAIRWVKARAFPILDEQSQLALIVGIAQDITPQKLSEQAFRDLNANLEREVARRTDSLAAANRDLRAEIAKRESIERELSERESQYRSMVETCSEWIWEMDLAGRHTYTNRRVTQILGYEPDEFLKLDLGNLLHPEERAEIATRLARHIELGQGWSNWVVRFRGRDGEYRTLQSNAAPKLDDEGRHVGYIGADHDITAQTRTEQMLQQSESQLHSHFANNPMPITVWRAREGEFVLEAYNEAARVEPDSQVEMLVGNNLTEVFGDAPDVLENFRACFSTQRPVRKEMRRTSANGNDRYLDVTYVFVPPDMVMMHTDDLTARKVAEEAAQETQDRLAHVGRLNMMGEMATGLAHELNQPLSAISNYCYAGKQALANETFDPNELSELLGKMEHQAIRSGDIIRRLRQFVGKHPAEKARIDVADLLDDACKLMEPSLRQSGVRLEVGFETAPYVYADRVQVQQVLINLIRNAMDAMGDTPIEHRRVELSCALRSETMVEFVVRDQGRGVPQDLRDKVFDAFVSDKPDGMGLGLAISRTIIESHGGKLWLDEDSSSGTVVRFELPMATEERVGIVE